MEDPHDEDCMCRSCCTDKIERYQEKIKEAEGALRGLIVRCGVTVTSHPGAPLWSRIGDVADAIDAEIARLKGEVVNQRHEIGMLLGEIERLKRALAAGPAALVYRSCSCCWLVEAAQEAAMKDDDKKGGV